MSKPTAQQCHAMTSYFATVVTKQTGSKPTLNRNKARWGFEAMLMDYTTAEAKELIDHYVAKYDEKSLSLDWFLYNYDKVETEMNEAFQEELLRAARRKETERRAKEWADRWKK